MKTMCSGVILVAILLVLSFVFFMPSGVFADESVDKTSVKVKLIWDDSLNPTCERSEYVTIKLFANGINTGKTLSLSERNHWTDTFTELDEYEGDEKIAYTIEESNICDDYSCVVTGDAATGYTIRSCSAISCIAMTVADTVEEFGLHHAIGLVFLVLVLMLLLLVGIKRLTFS